MYRRATFSFAILLGASSLLAQQAPSPSVAANRLSTRSDLVLVPVVVTGKAGAPVSGLSKEAFKLEENGKVRDVSVFEEMQISKNGEHAQPSSPNTYANYVSADERSSRFTVIILDMINTPSLRQIEARKQLTDYLLRIAILREPIALYGLNENGLHEIHRLTANSETLILALQKLKVSLSSGERTQPPSTLTDDPTIDQQQVSDEVQVLSEMFRDQDDTISANIQRVATRQTLAALTQLAGALQSVPGRKTLIWATAGFPFVIDDPQSFARQGDDLRPGYEDAWRSLNAANIAVYPVDLGSADSAAKNLPSANATISSSQINTMRGRNGLRSPTQLRYDEGEQQRLTLHAVADATGGRGCVTISELEKCFSEAIDDSRDYYVLGYYLADDTSPGWRKLKVLVAGDGLQIRYRTGFYAAPKLEDTPEQRRKEIVDALASVVPYTGLRLTARLASVPDGAATSTANSPARPAAEQNRSAEVMLGVMGDTLTVDHEKGNAIDLMITTLAFDNKRKSVASMSQSVATSFNPERLQKVLQTGLGIPEGLKLPPGKYEIKFAVRDNLSGRIGTVSLPLELK